MIFSKSSEYAIRAVMYLCLNAKDDHCFKVKDISSAIGSPEYYTSKVLQSLVRQKIIFSNKGPSGGFYIDKTSKSVKLYDLVIAVEGSGFFDKCLLGLNKCTEKNPCPLHLFFTEHRNALKQLFLKKSVSDILIDQKNNKIYLK